MHVVGGGPGKGCEDLRTSAGNARYCTSREEGRDGGAERAVILYHGAKNIWTFSPICRDFASESDLATTKHPIPRL